MLYHCGLLDERPANSRTLNWIRRTTWGKLPPELEHELRVWLAMPGFSVPYHAHALGVSRQRIEQNIGGYEEHKADVIANWLSATREDCVKLARLRSGQGHIPLISQLRAVEDLKHMSMTQVARDYGVHLQSVIDWLHTGFRSNSQLPSGFELLVKK